MPANRSLWHEICGRTRTGIRFTAGLPDGVPGGRWPNGCLAPAIQLAEVVLARQGPRFYTWLWRRYCATAKSNSWAAVSLHRQIAICAIPFFQSLFDFRVAHAARNSWLTCVHQKGKQVGNFSQRERVEQARRHRRFLARQDFFNVFVGQRDFLATSL